jgi:hypothetical protein
MMTVLVKESNAAFLTLRPAILPNSLLIILCYPLDQFGARRASPHLAPAFAASLAALTGYFHFLGSISDVLVLYGRARGTFNHPNVLLDAFLSGGWLAGFCYLALAAVTIVMSARFLFVPMPGQPIYHAIYAAYVGTTPRAPSSTSITGATISLSSACCGV